MNKNTLIILFISLGLVACHNDKSSTADRPEKPLQPENTLTIKGHNINEQVGILPNQSRISIVTPENDPVSTLAFASSNVEGSVAFAATGNKASLSSLQIGRGSTGKTLTCAVTGCIEQSTYQWLSDTASKTLKLSINAEPKRLRYTLSGVKQDVPVKVSGALQLSAPANWPVWQTNRFPLSMEQGKLMFDGKKYTIKRIVFPHLVELDTDGPTEYFDLWAVNGTDMIHITMEIYYGEQAPDSSSNESDNHIYLTVSKGKEIYSASLPALPDTSSWDGPIQDYWVNSGKTASIKFDRVNLSSKADGQTKVLDSSLEVPTFDQTKLKVEGESLPYGIALREISARAENDRKIYTLFGDDAAYTYDAEDVELSVVHELKGHLSLKYIQDGDFGFTATCGDRDSMCAGLSLDVDQKTYRFNKVKLGSLTLNGSLYIPGVFR